jgi:hypothetical protein
MHFHLTFSGVVCILSLWEQQEQCPFTTRLRVLKLSCCHDLPILDIEDAVGGRYDGGIVSCHE